jgi:hypothetical protein
MDLFDKDFLITVINIPQEQSEDVEKGKKETHEQNGNINKNRKNLKRERETMNENSGAKKYN